MHKHRLLIYKGISTFLITFLRNAEHEVYYIPEEDVSKTIDDICKIANGQNYILMTKDLALAEELYTQKRVQAGIIALNIVALNEIQEAKALSELLFEHRAAVANAYSVFTERGAKIKPMETA